MTGCKKHPRFGNLGEALSKVIGHIVCHLQTVVGAWAKPRPVLFQCTANYIERQWQDGMSGQMAS